MKTKILVRLIFALATACLVWATGLAPALPAEARGADYYATVDNSSALSLRGTLHDLIDDHTRFRYTYSSTDVWDILGAADQDPNNASRVLDIYQNASFAKSAGDNAFYDREHSWPKSYGFVNDNLCNYPYTDVHHLFVARSNYNSARNNKPYEWCPGGCTEFTTMAHPATGGGASGSYPSDSNWTDGGTGDGRWETWRGRRGDVARAQFYMDVRYEGGAHGVTGCEEPNLILTDNMGLVNHDGQNNFSPAYMGKLTTLLEWHFEDPVDAIETRRNGVVFGYQGNRNPFIDHPEYVCVLWAAEVAEIEARRPGLTNAYCSQCDNPQGPPAMPLALAAIPSDGLVALDWADNSDADLTGYNIYRATTAGGPYTKLNGAPVTISQYSDTTVANGTTYYYVVRAADCAHESANSAEVSATPMGGGGGGTGGGVWINEFHYDNSGTDSGEFVEVAGPAGTDLSGWVLGAYNGLDGRLYDWVSLSGVIPNQQGCYGTLAFAFPDLQNGAPDGLALVNNMGFVVQFLSYEGPLTATDGAASGLASSDVGVSETGTTPVGHSLQLGGTGHSYSAFAWQAALANTQGQPNANQTFDDGCPDTTPPAAPGMLTASGGNMVVSLEWPDSPEADLAGYNVYQGLAAGGPWTLLNASLVASSDFLDANVVNGTTYYYYVTAVDNASNESAPSNVASATPMGPSPAGNVWINEFHYDNDGADTGEFVEIAGLSGIDLAGCRLHAYNGTNGQSYATVAVSGIIPNQQNCYGTLAFDFAGLQNGPPDGIALVDASGGVIQFLSYEGSFAGTTGPAAGMSAQDVVVFENGTSPAGQTLQLTGSGIQYGDFAWQAPAAGSPGQPNAGQTFAGGCMPPGAPDIRVEPSSVQVP
jgi:endonuclease I